MKKPLHFLFLLSLLISGSYVQAQCTGANILSVTDITMDSVSFSWSVAGVDTYQYAVLPASSAQPTSGTITSDNSVRAGGLTPGIAHKIWIGTDCGSGVYTTTWTSQTFMAASCGTPASIDITNIGADTAIITWTAVAPTVTYEYVVDTTATAPTGTGTAINTNTILVRGLMNATKYYVYVRTHCGTSVYSPWSPAGMFFSGFTLGVSNPFMAMPSVKAYPNPVSNTLQLQLPQATGQVEIWNTLGAVVYKSVVSQQDMQLDMSAYAPGLYILKYSCQSQTATIKIYKK